MSGEPAGGPGGLPGGGGHEGGGRGPGGHPPRHGDQPAQVLPAQSRPGQVPGGALQLQDGRVR